MPNKSIPSSAGNSNHSVNKIPNAFHPDYSQEHPCWRIGHFDYNSKWGLNNLGRFKFIFSEKILNIVSDNDDNKLYEVLDSLGSKQYSSIKLFWKDFYSKYNDSIPTSLVNAIQEASFNNAFTEKIYPKLKTFEDNTWSEIRQYTHRHKEKQKTNSHNVPIKNLIKEAQDRLEELGFSDRSEIFSLRLEGKIRIYGFLEKNFLDIIWIDLEHEIYKI